nr:acyclic terpene utilization AtuA family protein [Marinicella sp. W31]MDC2880196.1 acyclic terpene utilization AtuA family protein [Marinicella sp. W31]
MNTLVPLACHQAGVFQLGKGEADGVTGSPGAGDNLIFHQPLTGMPVTGNDFTLQFAMYILPVFRLFRHVLRTPAPIHELFAILSHSQRKTIIGIIINNLTDNLKQTKDVYRIGRVGAVPGDWAEATAVDVTAITAVGAGGANMVETPFGHTLALSQIARRKIPRTVKEQFLYNFHHPAAYFTPDVTLDISAVTVHQVGEDRVRVENAGQGAT